MQAPKLVIFGRDGTLNIYRADHVKDSSEWQAIPGALEAVARLNQAGWHAVVATNQAGIGRGIVDMGTVNSVHLHMMKQLAAVGGRFDAIFFCPHAPQEECECRKPLPGLVLDAARRYGADLSQTPLVCDNLRDLQTAQNAGCQPHLVRTGRAAAATHDEVQEWLRAVPNAVVHDDLQAFAQFLLSRDAPTRATGYST